MEAKPECGGNNLLSEPAYTVKLFISNSLSDAPRP